MVDTLAPGSYTVDARGATGVAIGDQARVIQHIAAVYNIQPAAEGRPRITARARSRMLMSGTFNDSTG